MIFGVVLKGEGTLGDLGYDEKQYQRQNQGGHVVLSPVVDDQADLKDKAKIRNHSLPSEMMK